MALCLQPSVAYMTRENRKKKKKKGFEKIVKDRFESFL